MVVVSFVGLIGRYSPIVSSSADLLTFILSTSWSLMDVGHAGRNHMLEVALIAAPSAGCRVIRERVVPSKIKPICRNLFVADAALHVSSLPAGDDVPIRLSADDLFTMLPMLLVSCNPRSDHVIGRNGHDPCSSGRLENYIPAIHACSFLSLLTCLLYQRQAIC